MGSSSSRYGEMRRPEGRSEVYKGKNGLQTAIAAYEIFREIAARLTSHLDIDWYTDDHMHKHLYSEARELIRETSLNPTDKEAIEIPEALGKKASPLDATGLFLSALLNGTGMKVMIVDSFPEMAYMGYELKFGKLLVMGKKTDVNYLGEHSRGVILNYGDCGLLGLAAEGGLCVNWGRIFSDMASLSKGGVHVNLGDICDFGVDASGFLINMGTAQTMYPSTSLMYNAGEVERYDREKVVQRGKYMELAGLEEQLNMKIREIECLNVPGLDSEAIDRIRQFDFASFEREVSGIRKEMAKVVRREYGTL